MKLKSILTIILMAIVWAGCTEEEDRHLPKEETDVAYVSIRILTPIAPQTRASDEDSGEEYESTITKVYVVAFNTEKKLTYYGSEATVPIPELSVGTPEEGIYSPEAVKVASDAKYIFLVSNPGTEMKALLENLANGTSWDNFNKAITEVNASEIRETDNTDFKNFAMVNSGVGDGEGKFGSESESEALVPLGKVYTVEEYGSEKDAKDAAEKADDKPLILIDRLTSKIEVAMDPEEATITENHRFVLDAETSGNWILDAVNTTFYPWAKKEFSDTHDPTPDPSDYSYNFYTIDPNYTVGKDDPNTGLTYNKRDRLEEDLGLTWISNNKWDYCIENTMDPTAYFYQNATRVIIRAKYYPGTATDYPDDQDWFSIRGTPYKNLGALKQAYEDAGPTPEDDSWEGIVKAYCEKFLEVINSAEETDPEIESFDNLQQSHLDDIANGGEIVRVDGCVKWYQEGRCYYYYEIRHNDEHQGHNEAYKYGVVRNNWYNLSLRSIKGPGSPWYPSIDPEDPDPEYPQPEDPLDPDLGFVSFDVKVARWVYWTHGMDI